jgi:hypothetical protein
MVAANENNAHPTINYFRLLTKLKADLLETIPKKQRNAKKIIFLRSATTTSRHLRLQKFLEST